MTIDIKSKNYNNTTSTTTNTNKPKPAKRQDNTPLLIFYPSICLPHHPI